MSISFASGHVAIYSYCFTLCCRETQCYYLINTTLALVQLHKYGQSNIRVPAAADQGSCPLLNKGKTTRIKNQRNHEQVSNQIFVKIKIKYRDF